MSLTPNMGLTLGSPLVTAGPLWAANHEGNWATLDAHDHSSGKGLQIGPPGLNINVDLPFSANNATQLRTSRYNSQNAALALGTDLNCVYVVAGNLYYNNGSGQAIQITAGTAVNVAGVGGISGMGGTTAAVTYFNGSTVFIFTSASGVSASMDMGPITLRQNVASAHGVTMQSPNSLAGDYSMTWFSALPGNNNTLPVISSTGTWSTITQIQRLNLPTVGQQVSSSSGLFSTSSGTTVNVTNLSVTITTTGRPVMIMFVPDGTGQSDVTFNASSASVQWNCNTWVNRDSGTATWENLLGGVGSGSFPPGTFNIIDTSVSAGTHTYVFQVNSTGAVSIQVQRVLMLALEL